MTWYVLGRLKARIFGFLGCVLSFSDGQACKAWFSLLPRGSLFFRPKKERPWERGRAEVACVGHSMAAWNIYWKGRRFTERRKTRKFRFPFCWGEKRKTNWFNNQLVKERELSLLGNRTQITFYDVFTYLFFYRYGSKNSTCILPSGISMRKINW